MSSLRFVRVRCEKDLRPADMTEPQFNVMPAGRRLI